jgi:hypothetical protein
MSHCFGAHVAYMLRCCSQMFNSASAFNQNVAVWNVVHVTSLNNAFDSTTALADCYKKGIHTGWGVTLQAAYPTWSSLWCERLSRTLGLHGDATYPWPFLPMRYPRARACVPLRTATRARLWVNGRPYRLASTSSPAGTGPILCAARRRPPRQRRARRPSHPRALVGSWCMRLVSDVHTHTRSQTRTPAAGHSCGLWLELSGDGCALGLTRS